MNFFNIQSIVAGIVAFLSFLSYIAGKRSVKNKENKEVVENVKKQNRIKKEVSRLDPDELDHDLQKWSAVEGKH